MHIYVFGSICRGQIDFSSDVDLLAIAKPNEDKSQFDPQKFSIYRELRIKELWEEGNPFAWHLHLESKLVYSSDGTDILVCMGKPNPYLKMTSDLDKFHRLFLDSLISLKESSNSDVFDLSMLFLAIRNYATCYSLGKLKQPFFSRDSALLLGSDKIKLPTNVYRTLERARIISTRGTGVEISNSEKQTVMKHEKAMKYWFDNLKTKL